MLDEFKTKILQSLNSSGVPSYVKYYSAVGEKVMKLDGSMFNVDASDPVTFPCGMDHDRSQPQTD